MPFPTGDTMVCRDCERNLPIDNFSRNGRSGGYRRPECRSCQHKRSKERNRNYQHTPGVIAARRSHSSSLAMNSVIRGKLVTAQNGECQYCDSKITAANCDIDHICPLARGGADSEENLQALCSRCNKEKHSKTHDEYLEWLISHGEHKKPDRSKVRKLSN